MRKLVVKLAVSLLGLCALQAQAQLIASDSSFGQNTHITDTQTGLNWLRLDFTQGLSLEQTLSQLGAGGSFEGYRLATGSEIDGLFTQYIAGPYVSNTPSMEWWSNGTTTDPTIVANSFSFLSLFGATQSGENYMNAFVYGACAFMGGGICQGNWVDVVGWGTRDGIGYATHPDYTVSPSYSDPRVSAMLVAQPIPEPSTYVLILAGLLGLGLRLRQKLS